MTWRPGKSSLYDEGWSTVIEECRRVWSLIDEEEDQDTEPDRECMANPHNYNGCQHSGG